MATRQHVVETYKDGKLIGTQTVTFEVSTEQINDETIRQQALDALTANRTYIARQSPTAAQNTAQIQALTRQVNGLIRLVLGRFDGTD
jgi:hypothetical protein